MNQEQANRAYMNDMMQQVADSLRDLCLTIDTLSLGLEQEKTERQVLASLNSIRHCVKSIWSVAHEALKLADKDNEGKNLPSFLMVFTRFCTA